MTAKAHRSILRWRVRRRWGKATEPSSCWRQWSSGRTWRSSARRSWTPRSRRPSSSSKGRRPGSRSRSNSRHRATVPPWACWLGDSGCWNVSNAYASTNVFGSWLYKITVSGGFCTNGFYVYSKWFNGSWGETTGSAGATAARPTPTPLSPTAGWNRGTTGLLLWRGRLGFRSAYPCLRLIGYWNGGTGADRS